ncbi:hypothetical protein ACM46_14990 [Chryseobacterium angstadtii]|uniref:Uncharacterized protein n=1 Tax=Chryseobacterium angstadtii TaxID=558151 RepID=A0A0J7KW40_9FLAO|nr:hypothetical protein [Chryseobacterium angstadtii]KMQ61340.1 hypothetical protein ACM46_14990 [Chryseobacterium angstadtii]
MKIVFIIILSLIINLFYSQDYIPDFDIPKFIKGGGVSKEIYRKKNGKLELSEKFYYEKDSALLKLTTHQILLDGNILTGVNYFLDSQNRIIKEEIQTSNSHVEPNIYLTKNVTINYFDTYKVILFHDKQNKVYLKEYYFYNDKKELVESFIVSNDDLTLHERSIYYKKNGYQINEKETFTDPRYKTIVKTKLDKNGFPIYIESEGKLMQNNEKIPKQITYYENEIDARGNLSKVFIMDGKKKELIKEVINKYE